MQEDLLADTCLRIAMLISLAPYALHYNRLHAVIRRGGWTGGQAEGMTNNPVAGKQQHDTFSLTRHTLIDITKQPVHDAQSLPLPSSLEVTHQVEIAGHSPLASPVAQREAMNSPSA